MLELTKIGVDSWGREVYKDIKTGYIFKLIDNCFYTAGSFEGEPECPIRADIEVVIRE